ncbi:MAG: hypothetical protein Q7U23_06410 [Methylococcales bacterium]|nr:hypothetical protein [Methylococcales bacterium]
MKNENIDHVAGRLQMSPTLERLYHLATGCPCDVNNPDDLKAAFSTCGISLIDALDNNRITFKNDEDKALFYGLLTVTIDYAMDGKLKTAFKPVPATSKH